MKKISFALFAVCLFCVAVFAQNPTIQQYLNIRSASSPALSNDGKRLVYLTNVTGTSQIWMIDLPNGQPKQITDYEDNVGFVRWSPAGSGIVFGKARGGDENTQFFWMANDGSGVRQLTADPKVRHNFGEWSSDGKKIFYASNKRDRNYFDIYSMEVETGKEELLLQNDGSNSVAAISDDGSKIVVSRSSVKFSLDNDLYLLDARTKQETHLTPHTEATQYSDVYFIPDGNSLILGTNQGKEFVGFSKMDLTRKTLAPINRPEGDLDATALSDDGKMFAHTVNREGFSEMYVSLAASITKKLTVPLPAQGIVGGLDFSKDGRTLAFTFSSAKHNSDIWLYDLNTKTVTQITKSDRAGIPQETFVEPKLIKFNSFDWR
ncbi:MAG: Dipeptidyl aminopeptidase/acylaminoacyl peptidase [Acidobacteria bacterium]|nr:Dipeptidyl aminopeptidase/acylaminoacyl peptidase [Acidobacteriota bacterium]